MTEEKRTIHPSEEVIERVSIARETYAPIVNVPFSPTGKGINLKQDVELVGTKGRVVYANLYPIMSPNGELGYINLEDQLSQLIEEKKESGDYEEIEVDGKRAAAIKGEVELTFNIEPLVLEGKQVNALEVFVSIALYSAETEDDARELLTTFFTPDETASKGETPALSEEIDLAQFDIKDSFVNHSLAMKTLKGMVSIAFGETSYELTPRGGKSGEAYRLTASTDACARFFAEDGGNAQIMSRILETIHSLITDENAPGFTYNGRIWFTTSKILEEVLRTQAGTVQGRKNVNRKMVDDAILAASSAQIVGTNPAGEAINVEYFVNAVRRDVVTFRGNTYRDVWGFDLKGWTINNLAIELEQAFRYPLLDMGKPLTVSQAAVERFLKDKLHEARGRLYTSNGKRQRRKSYTQRLSWETIFKDFQPLEEMNSRQKRRLVEDFQSVLTVLAEMDSKDELHPGRPLYINAHSERQAGRGRGAGAWSSLIIEYSSSFHRPKIKLT